MTRKRTPLAPIIALVVAGMVIVTIPPFWCGRESTKWLEDDLSYDLKLSRGVARLIFDDSVSRSSFRTGSGQFNGEWLFGTYIMAGIGFTQVALAHPETREQMEPLASQCIEKLLTDEISAFDKERWNEDPIDGIGGDKDHAAYLGYLNFLIGLHRLVFHSEKYAALNDQITGFLKSRLASSSILLLQSYPGEVYPVDNCWVIGSIGLHQRATNADHGAIISQWVQMARARYVDADTHLLVQAVNSFHGGAMDAPRGSGTALGLIAAYYADSGFARDLYDGIKQNLAGNVLGFGGVREYPKDCSGTGDIDSGPVIFGYGFSATGFAIAGAKRYSDKAFFRRLQATAYLCGAPVDRSGRREYISGGPLGNAILLAMFTTPAELKMRESGSQ